jgi:hypothetical protein
MFLGLGSGCLCWRRRRWPREWDRRSRGLQLYTLALSLVEAKGGLVTVVVMTFKEYQSDKLSVVLMPGSGNLDIWYRRKVLAFRPPPGVTQYTAGEWEEELEAAATH